MLYPDNKVHGATMGPTWGRQDPGGPHLATWILLSEYVLYFLLITVSMEEYENISIYFFILIVDDVYRA